MKSNILEDLLHQELRSLYSAEKQLLKALTKMAKAAAHPKLRAAFGLRLKETEVQIKRLEQIGDLLKRNVGTYKCRGMEQMIRESEALLAAPADDQTHDERLVAAVHDLGRYEIEEYTMAMTLASRLGLDEVEDLLRRNHNEERAADTRLTKMQNAWKRERALSLEAARPLLR